MTVTDFEKEMEACEREKLANEREAFERLLQAEICSFQKLVASTDLWEEGLRTGANRFDFGFDQKITSEYRKWVLHARIRDQQLTLQEAKDTVPSAETFRAILERAEEILLERTQDEAGAVAGLQEIE